MKQRFVNAAWLATAFVLLAQISCKGDKPTEPPVATAIVANSSTSITGIAGSAVTPAPSVIVSDQFGAPMAGIPVLFSVSSGGGSASGATVNTDAAGVATVGSWTLGPGAGTNVLTATSGALTPVVFTATANAGTATSLAKNAGDNQTAVAGTAVPVPPSVILKDANGNPTAGVTVTFAVASGGGSVTGATAVTNASGIATVGSWSLGPVVGANTLSATSGSLTAVTFAATSTVGAAASLAKNAGDNQAAAAGSAVPIPPSVVVKDANGNAVSGVTVTFAVTAGGGSVTGGTAVTNSSGVATVGSWTLGPTVGTNTLSASAGSLAAVTFTATSAAGAAASLTRNAGDGQTAIAGSAVATAPSVLARDANGNPTSGVPVTFTVTSGGGSVTGATAITNSAGIATVGSWTLGPTVGSNTLTASSGSISVAFTATSTAGPAAVIVKNAGDNQVAPTGSAVAVPPSVIVQDANGNAKSGVTVTFAVASGGGSITGGTVVTNSSGLAQVGSWTLGSVAGTNSLTASVSGVGSVTFTAVTLAGACAVRDTHTLGTSTSGTLSSSDCQLSDGSFVDFYNVSVPQAGSYFFRESSGFDTYLLLASAGGTTIAENDDETVTGSNSGIKALLPSGGYLLGATTFGVATGDYTVSSAAAPAEVSNCEQVFIVKGVSTNQNIASTDCNIAGPGGTPIYSDRYVIFIPAGTTVTITMSSTIVDSFLQLVRLDRPDGADVTLINQNDNVASGTATAQITYTSTQSSYYAIYARSVPTTSQGPYTLTIQ